jgi:acyl carrier protein
MTVISLENFNEHPGDAINYIKGTIGAYIRKNFLLGADEVLENDASLIDAGVVDSTSTLELVEFIAKTFRIEISEREMSPENFDSIDRISVFIASRYSR